MVRRASATYGIMLFSATIAACSGEEGSSTGDIEVSGSMGLVLVDTVPRSFDSGEITFFDVDQNGTVAFADGLNARVTVFSTGGLTQTMGTRGEGPGEFQSVSGLLILEGGSIALLDPSLGRITKWRLDGTLSEIVSLTGRPHSAEGFGSTLMWSVIPPIMLSYTGDPTTYLRMRGDGQIDTVVVAHMLDEERRETKNAEDAVGYVTCPVCTFLPISESLVLVRSLSQYEFWFVDIEKGELLNAIRRDVPPVKFTEESFLRDRAKTVEGTLSRLPAPMRELLGDIGRDYLSVLPDTLPFMPLVVGRFPVGIDERNRVWVLRSSPGPVGSALDVFDTDGLYLNTVAVDGPTLRSIQVAGEWLVGMVDGGLGQDGLLRFHIEDLALR